MDTFARILYQKFFLRDVVGKIAPGGLAVLAVTQNLERLQSGGALLAFIALGVFFLLGLGLQVVGELIGLLSASPKPHHVFLLPVGWLQRLPMCAHWWRVNEDATERLLRLQCALPGQVSAEALAYWEYLASLREGAGNLALALLVTAVSFETGAIGVVALLLFFLLWSSHKLFAKRQARFEISLLARAGLLSSEEARKMGRTMGLRDDQLLTNESL
jgi:hypothetical protein